MVLTKEVLSKRKAELEQGLEQVKAQFNAMVGAMQELENVLRLMDRPAQEEPPTLKLAEEPKE